jgi:hypothetical protein
LLYLFLIPIMWLHWYLCYGHCALTLFDNYIHGRDLFSCDGVIYDALSDIFSLTNCDVDVINYSIWIISICLWLKVVYDLVYDSSNFKKIKTKFKKFYQK